MVATAGNLGTNVRSDCFVSLSILKNSGIKISLSSKVKPLYGNSILELCKEILNFYGIKNASLKIDDKGALPFTIAARLETVIHKLLNTNKEFLLPISDPLYQFTRKERLRRSRLYIPGNNPKLMINAGIYNADGIILDLEDSVAPDKKDEARLLVRNALRTIEFGKSERMVRINQLPLGLEDLKHLIQQKVDTILIPKCEKPEQVKVIDEYISKTKSEKNQHISLMPIIESALGIENAYQIASASSNVVALAIGLEDYTADLGTSRSLKGKESFYARSVIVNAASAAGIMAIDSVFSDINDIDTLKQTIVESKSLGFVGMGCIHPSQIAIINELYSPTEAEIEKAKKIFLAFKKAEEAGHGVIALGSKMIDLPVVKRATTVINAAMQTGKINKNWAEDHET